MHVRNSGLYEEKNLREGINEDEINTFIFLILKLLYLFIVQNNINNVLCDYSLWINEINDGNALRSKKEELGIIHYNVSVPSMK